MFKSLLEHDVVFSSWFTILYVWRRVSLGKLEMGVPPFSPRFSFLI